MKSHLPDASRRTAIALIIVLGTSLLACKKLQEAKKTVEKGKAAKDALSGPVILTGSEKGNYFKAATELNTVLGDDKLTVKSSPGSFDNLMKLGQGQAKYAIVQFDTLIMFLRMGGSHKNWANNSLGVAPLSNEYIHIIVNKKSKIKKLTDLKGKRIAAGSETSGSFVSAFTIMSYFNDINLQKYNKTTNEAYEKSLENVRAGTVDALVITSSPGMPLLAELEAGASADIELLDVGASLKLPQGIDYVYTVERLPGKTYPWQEKDINTLATPAFLFAYAKYSTTEVKKVATALYDNAETLQKGSKLWELATVSGAKKGMKQGVGFHGGATMYLNAQK